MSTKLPLAALLFTLAPVLTALGGPEKPLGVKTPPLSTPATGVLSPATPKQQRLMIATADSLACSSGCAPRSWEKQLREEYLAKYGSPTLHLPDAFENSRQAMALRLSTRFMDAGFREAAHELFNDPLFVSGIILSTAIYMAT